MSAGISAALLIAIAVLHSALGEFVIIGPLKRHDRLNLAIGRAAGEKVIRFAWHLTSVAWIGLALAVVGVPAGVAAGGVALISCAAIVILLRSHLAWPLFLAAGLYSLNSAGALPSLVLQSLVWLAIAIAIVAAVLHMTWALGSRWGAAHVFPEVRRSDTAPLGTPGVIATLLVAVSLGVFAGLLGWMIQGAAPGWAWWLVAVAALILVARTYGDGKYVGLLKTERGTAFARADDALFTPLIVLLATGAISTLHLAGTPF